MKVVAVALTLLPLACVAADPIMPTANGMTWNYKMTQEEGSPVLKSEAQGKADLLVTHRINGLEKIDGKDLLRFETRQATNLLKTDLLAIDENGVTCSAQIDEEGKMVKLIPPQKILIGPIKPGTKWSYDGQLGDVKLHQDYEILCEENVTVPAGKFRAFRIRRKQSTPNLAAVSETMEDRWFVPGTGFVKYVTTVRAPSGDLLERTSLELKESPKITAPNLTVGLSRQPIGDFTDTLASNTPKIYARWQGHGLRKRAKIRVVWIAENVPDVPSDYTIDEASAMATAPNSHGTFTLASPDSGWEPGNYRAQFYLDGALTATVRLTITK